MTSQRKVMTIVGARPQFVKAAPISRAFLRAGKAAEVLIHTGQHYSAKMSAIFFEELGIPEPSYNLEIHGGGHGEMTGRMLEALESVMISERADAVLVYGDTNSTLAGALTAAKLKIPVMHVEAGLRSFNRGMPEEINRVVADHLSSQLFCPTQQAVSNLGLEGIKDGVHFVGDVMFDATLHARKAALQREYLIKEMGLEAGRYAVCTVHRAENTDDTERLRLLVAYLEKAVEDQPIVWPMHPRTLAALERYSVNPAGIKIIEPIGYLDLHCLLANAAIVYTDSGGLQKEAYFHRVPCVTMRDETEWAETIEAGWNRLWSQPGYLPRSEITDYGEGRAAEKIVALILDFLSDRI
jgi:UDP-GlcNAc3NAcA epimerase